MNLTQGMYYYYPHFAGRKTTAQEIKETVQESTASCTQGLERKCAAAWGGGLDPMLEMSTSQCQTPSSVFLEITSSQMHWVSGGKVC